MSYAQRLASVRTKTCDDWWSFTFGYPMAWRVVAVIGDIRWITPNLLTVVSAVAFLAGAALLIPGVLWADIAALVVLQMHLVIDCSDGTLARYRKCSTSFGSFLDKAGDQIGFLFLGSVAGYRAFCGDDIGAGDPWIAIAGAAGAGCYIAVCYFYWVVAFHEMEAGARKPTVVIVWEEHAPELPGLGQRIGELIKGQWKFFHFSARDFPLWVPVLTLLGRPDIAALAILITQGATAIRKIVERGVAMAALDRKST